MNEKKDERINRRKKLEAIKEKGINPYPYSFKNTQPIALVKSNFEELKERTVTVAGRVLRRRGHGKTTFMDVKDRTGTIQTYFRKDNLKNYEHTALIDIGDIIGIKGKLFKTRTEEITILVEEWNMLSKSLRPLFEKWHGLSDTEIRYRKRYLDLIANEESFEIFRKRSLILKLIRKFLDDKGFWEVETPILQSIYGGAAAQPFKTYYNVLEREYFLRIADELYLKRLIVGGMEKVYEIGKDFRNEGLDRFHNPEFTQLELYEAYSDYNDMMKLIEDLIYYLTINLYGNNHLTFQEKEITIAPPFKRLSFIDTLSQKLGKDILSLSKETFIEVLKEKDIYLEKDINLSKIMDKAFSELIEPELIEPTFVIDYPLVMSPLAKKHRTKENVVERFELFIGGVEFANAYSELNDPVDQLQRLEEQIKNREEYDTIDRDFIEALETGMPPTGGLGIGIDRLTMLLTNASSIRDVILFPQLREKNV